MMNTNILFKPTIISSATVLRGFAYIMKKCFYTKLKVMRVTLFRVVMFLLEKQVQDPQKRTQGINRRSMITVGKLLKWVGEIFFPLKVSHVSDMCFKFGRIK